MAATTLTRQVDWNTNPELAQIRFHYQGLREQINRASAVAMALGTLQPRDTTRTTLESCSTKCWVTPSTFMRSMTILRSTITAKWSR